MKRSREKVQEDDKICMPKELLGEIAKHYKVDSIGDIVRFSLVCKSAQNSIHQFLEKWIDLMFTEKRSNHYFRLLEKYLYTTHSNNVDVAAVWKKEKAREKGPRKDFLLNFLELIKDAVCDEYYIRSNTSNQYVCQPFGHNSKTRISELFYFDSVNDRVIPMKKVPGLRTLAFPTNMKVREVVTALVKENTLGSIAKLATLRLEKRKDAEVKAVYHEIKRI